MANSPLPLFGKEGPGEICCAHVAPVVAKENPYALKETSPLSNQIPLDPPFPKAIMSNLTPRHNLLLWGRQAGVLLFVLSLVVGWKIWGTLHTDCLGVRVIRSINPGMMFPAITVKIDEFADASDFSLPLINIYEHSVGNGDSHSCRVFNYFARINSAYTLQRKRIDCFNLNDALCDLTIFCKA